MSDGARSGEHPAARFLTVGESGSSHGVYFRDEFASFGLTAQDRRRLLATGDITSPRKDWYLAGVHDRAVAAAVRSGGVLSCVSALRRYGFWVAPGYPEDHVRAGRWTDRTLTPCRGFSAMAAGRTGVDSIVTALECAARCMREEDWIAVCDSVQQNLGCSAEALRGEMGPLPKKAQRMFDKTDGRSQSGTESVTRVRLRARGFVVVVQPEIADVGRTDLRIGNLIIECDGERYHSSREAFQTDRTRDRKATVGGWMRLRLTYDDVLYDWDAVLEDILAITRPDRHRLRRGRISENTDAVGWPGADS